MDLIAGHREVAQGHAPVLGSLATVSHYCPQCPYLPTLINLIHYQVAPGDARAVRPEKHCRLESGCLERVGEMFGRGGMGGVGVGT